MLPFVSQSLPPDTVPNNMDIPKDEMDIFYRDIKAFLPPGKTFAELTPEELKLVMDRYRFDYFRPGQYQGITGMKGSI